MKHKRLIMFFLTMVFTFSMFGCSAANNSEIQKNVAVSVYKEDETENAAIKATEASLSREENAVEEQTKDFSIKEKIDETKEITIVAVGDIMVGRGVKTRLEREKKDYTYPFEKVAQLISGSDIAFANLENPATDSTKSLDRKHKYVLASGTQALSGIAYAGFDLISLANNHIMDYYDIGLFDTMAALEKHGIKFSGAGRNLAEARKPAIIEKNGIKVGLLAYTDMAELVYRGNPSISFAAGDEKAGVAPRKLDYIKEDIEKTRNTVDILLVSLHWGVEESFKVTPEQVEFAHALIDMGADAVLGHHPHQFQGIEIYKGKPVAYSLGNFLFDQNDPENQESFILAMKFREKKLEELYAIPVRTVNKMQVVPLSPAEAHEMIERQIELSSKLNTKCVLDTDKLVYELD